MITCSLAWLVVGVRFVWVCCFACRVGYLVMCWFDLVMFLWLVVLLVFVGGLLLVVLICYVMLGCVCL